MSAGVHEREAICLQVNLMREKLELTPVYSTAMEHDGHTVGYIRLVSFSQKAAVDTQHAIASLQVCVVCIPCPQLTILDAAGHIQRPSATVHDFQELVSSNFQPANLPAALLHFVNLLKLFGVAF